jgi:transposase
VRIKFHRLTIKKLEKEIRTAEKLNNLRLYKMVCCLLSMNDGKSAEDIGKQYNISTKTVYNWFNNFCIYRFSWLFGYHYQGRGRKSKLNKEQREKLYNIVKNGPEAYGYDCGIWNSAIITVVIEREFGVSYNPRYVCTLLQKIGITYQKAAFDSCKSDDEEHQKKRKEWEEVIWPEILKKSKDINAVIIFVDEVSFAQWGSLSRTWAPIGQQPKVKTSGKRKGLKIFGAIEFKSGRFQYMESNDKFNGPSYIEYLKLLINSNSKPIILIDDGAPYHTSSIVKEFKEEMRLEGKLHCYRLPSYSPDKNPIEKLWKKTKADATHCKYFATFEDLRAAVLKAFRKYMEDAREIIAVMKKLRSEAGIA